MKEYVLTEKDIEFIKKALYSPNYIGGIDPKTPKESIMTYPDDISNVCTCDDGFMCKHRLKWLIDYIENKEIRTRKAKLNKLNED